MTHSRKQIRYQFRLTMLRSLAWSDGFDFDYVQSWNDAKVFDIGRSIINRRTLNQNYWRMY